MTKLKEVTNTKLKRITALSEQNKDAEFKWLMPHFNSEALKQCYYKLDGGRAVGIDGQTKEEYGKELDQNIESLTNKMKGMAYLPKPIRRVQIPKDTNKKEYRTLGISCFEDKIVQLRTKEILESIYEPIFLTSSYGFRPGKSCHNAVKDLKQYIDRNWINTVIDVDLKNFFDRIDHRKLLDLLSKKIKDRKFLRYISRMLKAGVMTGISEEEKEVGTTQGSVVSPVLANIFAHYVIDEWIESEIKGKIKGPIELFRYCDDIVICCPNKNVGNLILNKLEDRLELYKLQLNHEKTKMEWFSRSGMKNYNKKQGTFDFLGFTYYLQYVAPKLVAVGVKTNRKRFRSKLNKVKLWIKENRHKLRFKQLWDELCIKLKGHLQYYGVSNNHRSISAFFWQATKAFFFWINRRSQKKSINWEKFVKFRTRYPLPKIRTCHSLRCNPVAVM